MQEKFSCMTYEEFKKYAEMLVEHSNTLDDGWNINNAKDCIYLTKVRFVDTQTLLENEQQCFLKFEYNIYYSISYNVPVFAFNVWRKNGTMLKYDEIQKLPIFRQLNGENSYMAISQQEHPLIFQPYFTIHPCRTHEIIGPLKYITKNTLISFISTLAYFVGLEFPHSYANV